MCLTIPYISKEQTAETDMICYKVIIRMSDVEFETLYRKSPIKIGSTYYSDVIVYDSYNYKTLYVDIGLHSFELLKDVNDFTSALHDNKILICKCTIPKGSKYYIGTFSSYSSYASTCLRYDEIC